LLGGVVLLVPAPFHIIIKENKMPKKATKKKKDTLGMAPAVHRNQLEEQIKELDQRIDTLIDDFGSIIDTHKDKIDKICTRMGINKL